MRRLNRIYRGIDAPTDVLSFPLDMADRFRGPDMPPPLLGDIVISFDTARRQARERGCGFSDEAADLLIHGLLHLLGYDHERSADSRRMKAAERKLRRRCWDE